MSSTFSKLTQDISQLLNDRITKFLEEVANNFSINKDELISLWDSSQSSLQSTKSPAKKVVKIEDMIISRKSPSKVEEDDDKELTPIKSDDKKKNILKALTGEGEKKVKKVVEEAKVDKETLAKDPDLEKRKLLNYNLAELKSLCKRHGLKMTGKKDELIKRLQGNTEDDEPEEKKETKKKSPTKKEKETKDEKVLKKIENNTPIIEVRRNEFGNLMHTGLKFVLDKETKEFYGKQCEDGSISGLTPDDIEMCKKYNLSYRLPENLDVNKKGLDDVKVEEIDGKDDEKEAEEEVEYEEIEYEEVEEEYEEDE